MNSRALVLFSGGQDSATCLMWALQNYKHVETIGFDYGQRHIIELEIRQQLITRLKLNFPDLAKKLGRDHFVDAKNLGQIGETAMTEDMQISYNENGLPNTFVPARNLYFFTLAAAIGYRRNIMHLVGGMCETDFSGYPDCRRNTMDALQSALSLGTDASFKIQTPLMWIDKASTWTLADELGGDLFVDMIVEDTHSCYLGDRERKYDWGFGCGTCPACELRKNGYGQWKGKAND